MEVLRLILLYMPIFLLFILNARGIDYFAKLDHKKNISIAKSCIWVKYSSEKLPMYTTRLSLRSFIYQIYHILFTLFYVVIGYLETIHDIYWTQLYIDILIYSGLIVNIIVLIGLLINEMVHSKNVRNE